MDMGRILEQFTGHRRGAPGGGGGLEQVLGGLLGGGAGGGLGGAGLGGSGAQRTPGAGGGLGGMLDALSSGGARPGGASLPGGMPGNSGGLGGLGDALGGMLRPPMGGGVGAAAAGGLLGSLLGGGRRGGGGGLLRMGGLAVLGTLAHRAYQQYQAQQGQAAAAPVPAPAETALDAPAADQHPFGLAVIRAMIAAAKADGHMDSAERERIFAEVEKLDLDADEKGFVFKALREDEDPPTIAGLARTEAQKAQLYLASRLTAGPDTAAERAWLEALAHELRLPAPLKQQLDAQANEAGEAMAKLGA